MYQFYYVSCPVNQKIKEQIGQPEGAVNQRDFKLTVFSFDNDSNLNTEEGKEKLREVGLNDELDVGRWIAVKLANSEENDISQNVLKFINEKEKSTLNSNKVSMCIFITQIFDAKIFEYITGLYLFTYYYIMYILIHLHACISPQGRELLRI